MGGSSSSSAIDGPGLPGAGDPGPMVEPDVLGRLSEACDIEGMARQCPVGLVYPAFTDDDLLWLRRFANVLGVMG